MLPPYTLLWPPLNGHVLLHQIASKYLPIDTTSYSTKLKFRMVLRLKCINRAVTRVFNTGFYKEISCAVQWYRRPICRHSSNIGWYSCAAEWPVIRCAAAPWWQKSGSWFLKGLTDRTWPPVIQFTLLSALFILLHKLISKMPKYTPQNSFILSTRARFRRVLLVLSLSISSIFSMP